MEIPSKKLSIVRKMSNKEKKDLQRVYYHDKSFRDLLKNSKELNWMNNLIRTLGVNQGANLSTPQPSTMNARFYDTEYIVNFNYLGGNPTDYTKYGVLSGFLSSQEGGQGGDLITFKIERFNADGITPATGPFFFSVGQDGPKTSPQLPGITTHTEADMLSVNDSIIASPQTIITQSNQTGLNISSATKYFGGNLTNQNHYLINNGDYISLRRTNLPTNDSLVFMINGYDIFTIPKDPQLPPHGYFNIYKRNNQIIRLTHLLPQIPTIVLVPQIAIPSTSLVKFYADLNISVLNYVDLGNALNYDFYVIASNILIGTVFSFGFYSYLNVEFGNEFTEGVAFSFFPDVITLNNTSLGGSSLTASTFKNLNHVFLNNMLTVYQHNNSNIYYSNKTRLTTSGVPLNIDSRNPNFTLNNGDAVSVTFNLTSVEIRVNGYVVANPTTPSQFRSLGIYKRKDQVIILDKF